MQLFAQVDNQGTAMPITTLCVHHKDSHRNHFEVDYSDILGKSEGYRKIPLTDPSWHDCTSNDELSCNVCGATNATPDLVGKTIQRISCTTVEGAWGDEPVTLLHFTDGTEHGFVHPTDD